MTDRNEPSGQASAFDEAAVPSYYSAKTADIVHKYGPGPRVHFHLGLYPDSFVPEPADAETVRRRIVAAQESMVDHAATVWGVPDNPPTDLLDIGCGLGGGAIYWAQQHGARVTALTNTPEHLDLIADYVRQAGIVGRVVPQLGDVHDLTAVSAFDAAVALESTGYMDRTRLFIAIARALRPGGWFGIEEHFIRDPRWTAILDAYYKTRLDTLEHYLTTAGRAGLTLEYNEDLTDRVVGFWTDSIAWSRLSLRDTPPIPTRAVDTDRLAESAAAHERFLGAWRAHAVETRLLKFRNPLTAA